MAIPLPSFGEIVDLIKKGATIEAQEKVMELRTAALALQEENISLRSQLLEIKEDLAKKEALYFDGSVYWATPEMKDGPFCQPCYDTKQQQVRMHATNDWGGAPSWHCYSCNADFLRRQR